MITARTDLSGHQCEAARMRTVRDCTVPPNIATRGSVITIDPKSLDLLLPLLDRNTLFRHHWGYRPILDAEPVAPSQRAVARKQEWERMLVRELEPELQGLWRDAKREGWLRPSAPFGIFPVQADGDELIVYDPVAFIEGARGTSLPVRSRFSFPRQPEDGSPRNKGRLCLADYFRPIESGNTTPQASRSSPPVQSRARRRQNFSKTTRTTGASRFTVWQPRSRKRWPNSFNSEYKWQWEYQRGKGSGTHGVTWRVQTLPIR